MAVRRDAVTAETQSPISLAEAMRYAQRHNKMVIAQMRRERTESEGQINMIHLYAGRVPDAAYRQAIEAQMTPNEMAKAFGHTIQTVRKRLEGLKLSGGRDTGNNKE